MRTATQTLLYVHTKQNAKNPELSPFFARMQRLIHRFLGPGYRFRLDSTLCRTPPRGMGKTNSPPSQAMTIVADTGLIALVVAEQSTPDIRLVAIAPPIFFVLQSSGFTRKDGAK